MRIRHQTTLDLEPDDLHEFGRRDLAAIEREWRDIARTAGFDDPAAYREALEADSKNIPTAPEDLIERATEQIARSRAAAPRFFGRLPASPCEVRPVEAYKEKDAPFAYYYPPSATGEKQGSHPAAPRAWAASCAASWRSGIAANAT